MRMQVYAIYDQCIASFNTPFFQPNDSAAKRVFNQACSDKTTSLYQNPEDFSLHLLGVYDADNGTFENCVPPVLVQKAQRPVEVPHDSTNS